MAADARTVSNGTQRNVAKVLIVDDDSGLLETFARMLRLDGYDVLTALDAETALREVAAFRPDAVIVDLRLPLSSGLTFLRELRGQEGQRHIPVAAITADYSVDALTRHDLKDLDADLFFKPLWLEDLARIVAGLIDKNS